MCVRKCVSSLCMRETEGTSKEAEPKLFVCVCANDFGDDVQINKVDSPSQNLCVCVCVNTTIYIDQRAVHI